MTPACILSGGSDRRITVGRRVYLFEDHPTLGPCPVNKDFAAIDLPPRSRFWHAVSRWYQQGKRLSPSGECFWSDYPLPTTGFVRVGKAYFHASLAARVGASPNDVFRAKSASWFAARQERAILAVILAEHQASALAAGGPR